MGTFDIINGDAHDLVVVPLFRSIFKTTQADLRALQVSQDSHCATGGIGCRTNPVIVLLMISVVAVGEVKTGNIHAVLNKT